MALKERIKATLIGLLIAIVFIVCLGFVNEATEGRYAVDSEDFSSVVELGEDVSLDGIKLVDNRTLGLYRFSVKEDMVVRVGDTDTAGRKELVISHGGKEYIIHFEVKYRVDFVADGVTVNSQLVSHIGEITPPDAPNNKTGYVFSHWDMDPTAEITASTVINAVYREMDYPSLSGLSATYGDTLGDIELTSDSNGYWEFIDPDTTPVGNAGRQEHAVRFVFYSDPDFFKYAYATVEVAKKEFDFATVNDTFYYDGEAHVPTVPGIETIYAGVGNVLPGVYPYVIEVVDDNYFGIHEGTYEILKPTVTVTVSSATIAYPASVPEFTYTVEGFDNVELLGIQIDAPTFATQVGEYEIGINYTNENVNYIVHKGILTVVKGDVGVDAPEISEVTFEDKLSDIEFVGKYLGTWAWETPDRIVDDINGITAYAIFTHDDPNLNPVRMAIEIKNVAKKTLTFSVIENEFVYESGKVHKIAYEIIGGRYPELYKTLKVSGNDGVIYAGTYRRTLVINDNRYEGSLAVEVTVLKADPNVSFDTVYETVWQENLRLESIILPNGYAWQTPNEKISESGITEYTATYTPADTDNYNVLTGKIKVNVLKAEVSIAGILDSYVKTYDGKRFDIKNSGIAAYYTDGTLTVTYYKDGVAVDEIVNAGEYKLVITVTEGKNYLAKTVERAVSVNRAVNSQTVITEQSATYLDGISVLTLPENVEGTWSWRESELGVAGVKTFTAVFTPDANANYLPREASVTVTVAKKTLDAPAFNPILYYNGKLQTLNLKASELYTVKDDGGQKAGTYKATLTLTDSDNYQWSNGTNTLTVSYSILKSDNAFTYLPENGVTFPYLSSLSSYMAVAKFGDVKAEYKPFGASDGDYTETVPKTVGKYTVRFTTLDTSCTAFLTETRDFEITPITVVPTPSLVDTSLEYNGKTQTATLKDTVDGIYTVTDTGALNAGEIGTVTLTIFNNNYVWADGSTVFTLTYEIVKAKNTWKTEPYISSAVTFGDETVYGGEAEFDTLKVYHRVKGSADEFIPGIPKAAGEYEIMFTTVSVNAEAAEERYMSLTVKKREIAIPKPNASLVYNGSEQIAIKSPSPSDEFFGIYTVEGGSFTLAGAYTAIATVTDTNYKWQGTDSASVEISYTVAKAQGKINLSTSNYELTYTGEDFFALIKSVASANNHEQTAIAYVITSYTKLDGTPLEADKISGAGVYVIAVSTEESANYLGALESFTVTVGKAALTVPSVSDKVYTGSEMTVEVENTDSYTVSGDIKATNVGEYTVIFTLTDPDNYEWLGSESSVSLSRTYRISTAVNGWAIEPENITVTYDGEPHLIIAEALHGKVSVVYTLGGEVVDAPVEVGVYNVTVTAVADNYFELVAYRTVTVTKATVTVPTPGALTYNGKEQSLNFEDEAVGKLYTVSSSVSGKNAGDIASATLTLTDSKNYKWSSTSSHTVTVSVTVEKANAVIDSLTVDAGWSFTEEESLPTASVIPSQLGFEGLTVQLLYRYGESGDFVVYDRLSKTDGKLNAGTYYVKAYVEGSENWIGTETEPVAFTVAKCGIAIPEAAKDMIFNGAHRTSGIVTNELYTVLDVGGTNAGTYYAYLTLTDFTNYEWIAKTEPQATVSYTVNKLTVTDENIDNANNSAVYGDTVSFDATVNSDVTGVDFGEYITYLYSLDGESWYESIDTLCASLGASKLPAGTYLVKTVISPSENWYSAEGVDTFTVSKKPLTPPTTVALTYNGKEQSAFVSTELYTVSGANALTVGTYTAIFTLTDADNYMWQGSELKEAAVSYTVNKAANGWSVAPAISQTTVIYNDSYTVSGAPVYDTLKYKYKNILTGEYTLIESLSELPRDVGRYEIVLYTESVNAEPIEATLYITINRRSVTKPTALSAMVYDGTVKSHGIEASDGIVIRSSVNATNAGDTVSVTLGLASGNYVWLDGTDSDITLSTVIEKATVTLGTVNAQNTVYTELPAPTVSVDKAFASAFIEYVYSSDRVNYYALSHFLINGCLPAGDYFVKATVNSTNVAYTESAPVQFKVEKATPNAISVSFGNSPKNGSLYYQNLLVLNESGTKVTYNGFAVEVSAYAFKMKGDFAAADTVYTFTVTPKDTDNFNSASIDVTVPLKTVATVGHGGTPYGTINDAVTNAKSGNVVWVVADNTGNVVITENLVIPSGVTLRLPYGSTSSDYNSNNKSTLNYDSYGLDAPAETNPTEHLKTYVRLAAGKRITVQGTLDIAGELSSGGYSRTYQEYAGHTARYYALLELETGAIIDINGTVRAFGYIREAEKGKSFVYVNAGGSLHQPFVLRDYRTGNYLKAASDNPEYSPFTRFVIMNVSPETTVYAGGKVFAYANIWAGSTHNHAEGMVIGADSSAFIQLSAGRLVSKYDIDAEVMNLHFYGGATLNEFKLSGGVLVGEISSADFPFALTYHNNIILDKEEGQTEPAVYTMGKNGERYKMLPGAKITVEEGVIFNVSTVNIYDGSFVEYIEKVNKNNHAEIISPILCYPDGKGDAMITVRGTLIAGSIGGKINTDTDGAKVLVTKSASVTNREITKFYEDTFSSKAIEDRAVTNTLQLYYNGSLSRSQIIVNVEYTASAADKAWNYVMPNTVEVSLQDGYGIYTDFAVLTDENGDVYIGTFDSSKTKDNPATIKVLEGSTVTFYLTKNQLFSETATSKVTVSSVDEIHSSDYTRDWIATGNAPVIYNVKALNVTGSGISKLTSVSFVYDTATGNVTVTLKSAAAGISSGKSFTVNGKAASSSGWLFKSYTYTATVTADTTLEIV